MKLKKCVAGIGMSLALFAAVATPAFAGGAGYGMQPGFVVANDHTICAGHGAFGAFGKDHNLAGGANGTQTGINNSALCGNPQD